MKSWICKNCGTILPYTFDDCCNCKTPRRKDRITPIEQAIKRMFQVDVKCSNCDAKVTIPLFGNIDGQLRKRDWIIVDGEPFCPSCYNKIAIGGKL